MGNTLRSIPIRLVAYVAVAIARLKRSGLAGMAMSCHGARSPEETECWK
jgi:hypothetical protein